MPSPFLARTTFRPIMLMSPLTMDRRPPWFPTVSKAVVCTAIAVAQAQKLWQRRKQEKPGPSDDRGSSKVRLSCHLL